MQRSLMRSMQSSGSDIFLHWCRQLLITTQEGADNVWREKESSKRRTSAGCFFLRWSRNWEQEGKRKGEGAFLQCKNFFEQCKKHIGLCKKYIGHCKKYMGQCKNILGCAKYELGNANYRYKGCTRGLKSAPRLSYFRV